MASIYFFSCPCGCGKTTLSDAWAKQLAREYQARLYYVVLTADEQTIRQRITRRGDVDLIDRALFLKHKLEHLSESQGHLLNNTGMTIEQELAALDWPRFEVVNKM